MAKKNLILTPQGHRVMGALATYIVPKLAADQSLQSVELEALCKSITPGRYDRQIDGIVGTVKERFGSRIAQDESFADLRKVLNALMPSTLAMDKKKEEEAEDEDGGNEDEIPEALRKNALKMKKKAKDEAEDEAEDEDEDEDDEDDEDEDDEDDEKKARDKKARDKKARDKKARDKKVPGNEEDLEGREGDFDEDDEEGERNEAKDKKAKDKKAIDAAMDSARTEGADLAVRRLAARYEAAEIVKPIVGKVNVFAADSAASIYKMALDAKGADLTGVPKVAYKAVLQTLLKSEKTTPKAKFAQDAAVTKSLLEEFPKLPGLA